MPTVVTPIETKRLTLRPFAESDLDALANILARPDVMRYLYEEPRTRPEVAATLAERVSMDALTHEGDTLMLAIVLRDTGQMIGDVSLKWTSQRHSQGEIGFAVHPDFQGKGYASEAATALFDVGFREIDLHRIIACADDRNANAIHVMERLGMRREAHFRDSEYVKGEWTSQLVYALIREEWEARPR
jgi:RimJ/RimL family protein N-acetyltransferase